jgi:hypothetical protein
MKKLLFVLGATAAMLLPVATAGASSGNDVAKGHGTTFFGDPFAFSATANFNDTGARGSVRLDTAVGAIEETIYGDVTCLRVAGGLASIAGFITDISPPNAAIAHFKSFVVQTSDSGKFGSSPDTVVYSFFDSPPPPDGACPTPSAGLFISSGDVVVQDAIS